MDEATCQQYGEHRKIEIYPLDQVKWKHISSSSDHFESPSKNIGKTGQLKGYPSIV